MQRVFPSPVAPVTTRSMYDVDRSLGRGGRPWLGLCMVASLDGSTVVDGNSRDLSSPNDGNVLRTLRQIADVLIVGAGTLRAEGYGPPSKPGQRVGVLTNSGNVDTDSDLFRSGSGFVIAPHSAPVAAGIDVIRSGRLELDLTSAITQIPELVPGAAFVQAEGGPKVNASLLDADLIDELNLSVSPQLAGGAGPRLTTGAGPIGRSYELVHIVVDDDSFVFTRWVRRSAC